ncbi:hypothetical protein K437DRAFT_265928 [Tilletiaria anomala UBC 951]|uniref:CRIB domain-containing protein n=1 Tax=Tilletiaria anomala (strain ATCC 24038 / CBS 436.72 / UBC 951) TaxID=1037660 RepID=A0A066WQI3_TILAU|nr:uncharacterized protein K437DRAFT_265928 [Tilletiaria anomala UBC 951]KDN53274.1 hypothetical protein K437DRAFT_265928 [Tilletiaria anomala UBC 951]
MLHVSANGSSFDSIQNGQQHQASENTLTGFPNDSVSGLVSSPGNLQAAPLSAKWPSKVSLHDHGASGGSDATVFIGGGGATSPSHEASFKRTNSLLSRRGSNSTQSRRAFKASSAALSRRAPPVSSDSYTFVSSDIDHPVAATGEGSGSRRSADMCVEDEVLLENQRAMHAPMMQSRASYHGVTSLSHGRGSFSVEERGSWGVGSVVPQPPSPSKRSGAFVRKKAISGPTRPASAGGLIGRGARNDGMQSPGGNTAFGGSASGSSQPARKRVVQKSMIGLPTNFQHTGHIGASNHTAATSSLSGSTPFDAEAFKSQMADVAAALRMDDIGLSLARSSSATPSMDPALTFALASSVAPQPPNEAAHGLAFNLDPIEEEAARIATLQMQKQRHAALAAALAAEAGMSSENPPPPPLPGAAVEVQSIKPAPNATGAAELPIFASNMPASLRDLMTEKSDLGSSIVAELSQSTAATAAMPFRPKDKHTASTSSATSTSSTGSIGVATAPVKLVYNGVQRSQSQRLNQGPRPASTANVGVAAAASDSPSAEAENGRTLPSSPRAPSKRKALPSMGPLDLLRRKSSMTLRSGSSSAPIDVENDFSTAAVLAPPMAVAGAEVSRETLEACCALPTPVSRPMSPSTSAPVAAATTGVGRQRRKPVPRSLDDDDNSIVSHCMSPSTAGTTAGAGAALPLKITDKAVLPSAPNHSVTLGVPTASDAATNISGSSELGQLQGTINRALLARAKQEEKQRVEHERKVSQTTLPQANATNGDADIAARYLAVEAPTAANGKALVEGPGGNLITDTANLRWNSALKEITLALAAEDRKVEDELDLLNGLKAADEALARLGQSYV